MKEFNKKMYIYHFFKIKQIKKVIMESPLESIRKYFGSIVIAFL